MTSKFIKKSAIQILIIIGSIALISLFSEIRQTANSNSLAQIPRFGNPPPNLLKPPKPQILPSGAPTPSPKPPEQPLVFAPPAQFRSQIVYKASISDSKVIALTFDDGPTAETLQILKILQKHKAVATFFCLGANLRENPEIAKRVVQAGNAIGNHTWHHFYHNVTEKTAADEIDNTGVHIYRSTGAKSLLFRPPGGRLNNGFADYAKKKNYVVVMWSIDPKDFSQPPAAVIARSVLSQATSGAIVLLHDGGGDRQQTVEAVSAIIPKLKQQGYRFVTVPQLLQMQASQKQQTADQKPK
ncbi:MAG: polysaccharide deacetylase family protein [Microcoleus sp. PH2017_10_PVI_O_A]|uniref:polysaccharide deacetylase family protein n=1 Tax=unclassified Microcoleus TaxID=2642155 RepID=UPI001DC233A4|nr:MULTISPECIES: polysaccharide deacetylase family protein [unclassified Microcoleus]TAE81097.1 MAG: polysaccharide deacetylase family protein [Oscillatoriales cyanobacterium]MCC3407276.1 polysaccharide deacetylase family protein [Microcoleus sp. PH2017_10_PVI_O_A]MCC3461352.1 polysaccharide deacetylase family protein [Microcoleus sp. PH2017_11_PCY_U_A]MCC3479807.1 polysaccharide deacetylase family protein [Microcoleus sp. PH2017_12_PCY_D_A]MCC3560757.1 polysaccharide deacetylase family protei